MTWLFLGFGVITVVLFHFDLYLPIGLSVGVFVGVSGYLIQGFGAKKVGLLLLLLWFVYALPFIHIPPYLWFDFGSENPSLLWGLAVRPYMLEERVVTLTAMLGAVGAVGIAFGASLTNATLQRDSGRNPDGSVRRFRTLATPTWLVWLAIGVALAWLAAPRDLLFTAAYTVSESALAGANFSSAWMMSHVIISFVFCDALLDNRRGKGIVKWWLIILAIGFVLVYLQLLRGNRAAVPWVFALALIYFYWAAGITQGVGYKIPWVKVVCVASVLVVVSMFIGTVRHLLVGMQDVREVILLTRELIASDRLALTNLFHGTWSAALLTPLSVAGDYVHGLLTYEYGKDYLNLLLSLPPGFLADAIGYVRPIHALQGPAWEMRYGMGGTHATVLPFRNFGMLGVFVISACWSYIMARYEKWAVRRMSVVNLSLLATLALASAHWLWYGEKNVVNALVLWMVFAVLYRIANGLWKTSSRELKPEPAYSD